MRTMFRRHGKLQIFLIFIKRSKFPKRMIFTQVDAEIYAATKMCHICERDIRAPTKKSQRSMSPYWLI